MKIRPKKSLGQNFLKDNNILDLIIKLGDIKSKNTVIEIGPGTGNLTNEIIKKNPLKLIVIEKDNELAKNLKIKFKENIKLINQDILKIKDEDLVNENMIIFGNLPYNISTQILVKLIRSKILLKLSKKIIFMFQKEVADRISAKPGTRGYGRTSVIAQWLCEVETAFCIPARAFVPPPKVVSAVVNFTPRLQPLAPASFKIMETVTAAAFGQRRKMLRSALKTLHPYPIDLLKRANINPEARAETLTVEEFCKIAESYRELVLPKISQ